MRVYKCVKLRRKDKDYPLKIGKLYICKKVDWNGQRLEIKGLRGWWTMEQFEEFDNKIVRILYG